MEKVLTPKERLLLIRKGNEIFNNGDIEKAAKIYTTTAYKDGLIRVGDYYYFDKKDVLKALHYYFEAKYEKRINEVLERIALVIKKWLGDKPKAHSPEPGKK
jgi:predicted metal-dependent hydrolase